MEQDKLLKLLKECRDLLVLCTLIDRSGKCQELVDKVDKEMSDDCYACKNGGRAMHTCRKFR